MTTELTTIDEDLQALEALAQPFWLLSSTVGLSQDDRDDVLQAARCILFTYPYNSMKKGKKGVPVGRKTYLRNLLPVALKTWRATTKIRTEAISQRDAESSDEFQREQQTIENFADPLSLVTAQTYNGAAILYDEPGLDGELETAPYKVSFRGDTPAMTYHIYPYHVPDFQIVPRHKDKEGRQILARRKHGREKGRRFDFTKSHLPSAIVNQLDDRRSRLASYIKEIVPEYLRRYGFLSLGKKYWGIISDLNKDGLSPAAIQEKRNISPNTYNARMATLKRRGWWKEWSVPKQREILKYFPMRDQSKELYSAMLDLELVEVHSIIKLAGSVFEDQLYEEEPTENGVQRGIHLGRAIVLKSYGKMKCEDDYDRKIRGFISDFVEQPIKTGISIDYLEEILKNLTLSQRVDLFCEALRRKSSLWDVIANDFTAVFSDILQPRQEAEDAKGEPTIASLLEYFAVEAKEEIKGGELVRPQHLIDALTLRNLVGGTSGDAFNCRN